MQANWAFYAIFSPALTLILLIMLSAGMNESHFAIEVENECVLPIALLTVWCAGSRVGWNTAAAASDYDQRNPPRGDMRTALGLYIQSPDLFSYPHAGILEAEKQLIAFHVFQLL